MSNTFKAISNTYNKLSNIGKILIFVSVFLIVVLLFKNVDAKKENFEIMEKNSVKDNIDLYDDFYASIYDDLVMSNIKNEFEIGAISQNLNFSNKTVILDVGSGTGHHAGKLSQNKNLEIIGIDSSKAMVNQSKQNYPSTNFIHGNVMDKNVFTFNKFTHILCLYFTIYYIKDKRHFFDNCMDWLLPGGYLYLHIVDRDKFDPILPPGNPLFIVSPQKYAKKRITNTNINFNDFKYKCDFELNESNNTASFKEKFKFNNGNTRTNNHTLFMEDSETILLYAQQSGFTLHSIIDLIKVGYENQYVYVFTKPG
jgi:SAM-dependent methyltransferase